MNSVLEKQRYGCTRIVARRIVFAVITSLAVTFAGCDSNSNPSPDQSTSARTLSFDQPAGVWETYGVVEVDGVEKKYMVLNSNGTGQQGRFVYYYDNGDIRAKITATENVTWKKTRNSFATTDFVVIDSAKRATEYRCSGSPGASNITQLGSEGVLYQSTMHKLGLTCSYDL